MRALLLTIGLVAIKSFLKTTRANTKLRQVNSHMHHIVMIKSSQIHPFSQKSGPCVTAALTITTQIPTCWWKGTYVCVNVIICTYISMRGIKFFIFCHNNYRDFPIYTIYVVSITN